MPCLRALRERYAEHEDILRVLWMVWQRVLGIVLVVLGIVLMASSYELFYFGMTNFDSGHNMRFTNCITGVLMNDRGSDGVLRNATAWIQMGGEQMLNGNDGLVLGAGLAGAGVVLGLVDLQISFSSRKKRR